VSDHNQVSHDHNPKHLLETGLLGKPKHGMQRVSDLAAKEDDLSDAQPLNALRKTQDEEQMK
jgi:hypothetical protein